MLPNAMHNSLSGGDTQLSLQRATPSSAPSPFRLVRCHALKAWQVQQLERASGQEKSQLNVKELCGNLQLTRAEVLGWLKANRQKDDSHSELRSPPKPAAPDVDPFSWNLEGSASSRQSASPRDQQERTQKRQQGAKVRLRASGEVPHVPGSTPWAQSYARKKLPRAAELTLEKVYAKWRHPPSNIIDSLWDLHQIPRRRALSWFARRREAEGQGSE